MTKWIRLEYQYDENNPIVVPSQWPADLPKPIEGTLTFTYTDDTEWNEKLKQLARDMADAGRQIRQFIKDAEDNGIILEG